MKFNDKLINLRKEKGLSQEEFGNELNVSRQAVSKWELGESKPDIDRIKEIAKFYNVSFDYLLDDDIYEKEKVSNKGNKRKTSIIIYILFIIFVIYVIGCVLKAVIFSHILAKNNINKIESYYYNSNTYNYNTDETTNKLICYKDNITYEGLSYYSGDGSNGEHLIQNWNYNNGSDRSNYEIKIEAKYGDNPQWEYDYFYSDNNNSFYTDEYYSLNAGSAIFSNISKTTTFGTINQIKDEFAIKNILNPFKFYKINKDGNIVVNRYDENNKYSKEVYYIDIYTGYLSKYEDWVNEEQWKETIYFNYEVNTVSAEKLQFNDTIKNEIIEKSAIHTYPIGSIIINNENWIKSIEIERLNETSETGLEYLPPVKIENQEIISDFIYKIKKVTVFNMEEFGAGDYFEGCPIITINLSDEETYKMTVCDNFSQDEDGSYNNVIALWKNNDEAEKSYYKIEDNLEEWILSII